MRSAKPSGDRPVRTLDIPPLALESPLDHILLREFARTRAHETTDPFVQRDAVRAKTFHE